MASPSASTQIVVEDPDALASLGLRPYLITGFLRQFLAQHFADSSQIIDPDLRANLWKADNTTNIVIESATRWAPDLVEGRPAVIIKRHAWQIERLGINDAMMGTHELQGYERHACFVTGAHTLFCIDDTAAAAEKLAIEVLMEIMSFASLIRRWLDLHRFLPVSIDEPMQLEESSEHYGVPITVAYAAEESWTLRPHASPIKSIGLTLDLNYFRP